MMKLNQDNNKNIVQIKKHKNSIVQITRPLYDLIQIHIDKTINFSLISKYTSKKKLSCYDDKELTSNR